MHLFQIRSPPLYERGGERRFQKFVTMLRTISSVTDYAYPATSRGESGPHGASPSPSPLPRNGGEGGEVRTSIASNLKSGDLKNPRKNPPVARFLHFSLKRHIPHFGLLNSLRQENFVRVVDIKKSSLYAPFFAAKKEVEKGWRGNRYFVQPFLRLNVVSQTRNIYWALRAASTRCLHLS